MKAMANEYDTDIAVLTGRTTEVLLLKQLILDGKNAFICGSEGMGKATLIKHSLKQTPQVKFSAVNFLRATSALDVAKSLYEAIYKSLGLNTEESLQVFSKHFSEASLELILTNEKVTIKPILKNNSISALLSDAFHGAERICKEHSLKMVFVVEEFQRILDHSGDELLLELSERLGDLCNISFIFTGSQPDSLKSIFLKETSSLYMKATQVEVDEIDLTDLHSICSDRFKCDINFERFKYLYEACRANTGLVIKTCWWLNHEAILSNGSTEDISKILHRIINDKNYEFTALFGGFTLLQRKAIKMITKVKERLFATENLKTYGFNGQQLTQTLKKLLMTGVVEKNEKGDYKLSNTMFHIWCEYNI